MDEQIKNEPTCVDNTNTQEIEDFKKVTLKYFEDIANILQDEELLKDYGKKDGRINWTKMRNIIKKEIFSQLKDEWEEMWENENLFSKLLELQNMKKNTKTTIKAWRPKTGDIGPQKRALEKKMLLAEINQLKKIQKEKEANVSFLKDKLAEEWKQIESLGNKVTEHQKTLENVREGITKEIDSHHKSEATLPEFLNTPYKELQLNTTLHMFLSE